MRLDPDQIDHALGFAGAVLAIVIGVRLGWVLLYNRLMRLLAVMRIVSKPPTLAQGVLVSWCGMRGLVTLATAIALPASFPQRDLVVLSALAVVLGTLVLQGLTLGPLIRLLRFAPDQTFAKELSFARLALMDAAIATLDDRDEEPARRLRETYKAERAVVAEGQHPRAVTESDRLHRQSLTAKRRKLAQLRRSGEIDDDVFHALEQELDWAELAASPPERLELIEG
jgi:CPA1 family monovalent cation:H+ antiporter